MSLQHSGNQEMGNNKAHQQTAHAQVAETTEARKAEARRMFASATIEFVKEEIDPKNAELRLQTRGAQRTIKTSAFERHVQMYRADEHIPYAGEPITHAKDGSLIDGQHRLMAVVKSGIPQKFIVKYGADDVELMAMGTGVPRNFADYLTIRGRENAQLASAIVKKEQAWRVRVDLGPSTGGNYTEGNRPTMFVLWDLYRSDERRFQDACRLSGRISSQFHVVRSLWGVLCYRFLCVDEDDAKDFILCTRDGDKQGASLPTKHPCWALRKLLIDDMARMPRHRRMVGSSAIPWVAGLVVKAWNAYRMGEPVGMLRFSIGGSKQEKFPAIDGYEPNWDSVDQDEDGEG